MFNKLKNWLRAKNPTEKVKKAHTWTFSCNARLLQVPCIKPYDKILFRMQIEAPDYETARITLQNFLDNLGKNLEYKFELLKTDRNTNFK